MSKVHTDENSQEPDTSVSTLLIRMPSAMKKRIAEICKATDQSMCAFTVALYTKAIAEFDGAGGAAAAFNLKWAQNQRLKLYVKINNIWKLLGGTQSKCYHELQNLCKSLGLKEDYSNLDSIIIQLIDYKPQASDSFSEADLDTFRELLGLMSEHRSLRLKIDAEIKRKSHS
jgi:hypothetical protein